MKKTVYILDASAIIGGFYSDSLKFTTNGVISELKDFKSKLILQSAIEQGHLKIREPDHEDLKRVEGVIKSSGDILRLSEVDKKISETKADGYILKPFDLSEIDEKIFDKL